MRPRLTLAGDHGPPPARPEVAITHGHRVTICGDTREVARSLEGIAAAVRWLDDDDPLKVSIEIATLVAQLPCPDCGLPLLDLVPMGSTPPCLVCGYGGDL